MSARVNYRLTVSGETKLVADNGGVRRVPVVLTDGAPPPVVANLHQTFVGHSAIHQSYVTAATTRWTDIAGNCRGGIVRKSEIESFLYM